MNYDHFSEGSKNDLKYPSTEKVKRSKFKDDSCVCGCGCVQKSIGLISIVKQTESNACEI